MRTAPKSKLKTRKKPNSSTLQDTIRSDSNLRDTFQAYPELLKSISDNPELGRPFLKLISNGCAPGLLLWLLNWSVVGDQVAALQKKDLDRLKSRFDSLIRRVESTRAEVVGLCEMRIVDSGLWGSLAFDDIDIRLQTTFARKFLFTELPDNLVIAKAFLKELKQNIAREYLVRNETSGRRLASLYLYCCAATGRRVTYIDIADLLNAGFVANGDSRIVSEAVVRMGLQRFKRSANAMSYDCLKLLMEDYVRFCPAGHPTLDDWFSSNGDDWISSHIAPISPGRTVSEQERRTAKLAEHKHPRK